VIIGARKVLQIIEHESSTRNLNNTNKAAKYKQPKTLIHYLFRDALYSNIENMKENKLL
jgi:hypothetical protein